jgi:hypothetical protein
MNSHANRSSVITGKATTTYTCPSADPDLATCGGTYTTANNELTAADAAYNGVTAQAAVNAFIASCKASKCLVDCLAAASNKDVSTKPASVPFTAACNPEPLLTKALGQTVCVTDATDDEDTCATAYLTVITKLTTSATAPWDSAAVKAAIDDFSVQCTSTACSASCKAVIDNKNVKAEYTSLKTTFTSSCNPAGSGSGTEGDDAFISIGKNNLLSLVLMSLLGVELLNFF